MGEVDDPVKCLMCEFRPRSPINHIFKCTSVDELNATTIMANISQTRHQYLLASICFHIYCEISVIPLDTAYIFKNKHNTMTIASIKRSYFITWSSALRKMLKANCTYPLCSCI